MTEAANNASDDTPFRQAIYRGDVSRARKMLENGEDANQRNYAGQSVLHNFDLDKTIFMRPRKLSENHYKIPALLKEHGFNFAALDDSGRKVSILATTVHHGFNLRWIDLLVIFSAPITEQVMYFATLYTLPDLLKWLIAHGGDPNHQSVLDRAAQYVKTAPLLMQTLLDGGATGPSDHKDAQAIYSTLAYRGGGAALATLISRGIKPNTCPIGGGGAEGCDESVELIWLALDNGHAEVMDALQKSSVSCASVDREGRSALRRLVAEDASRRVKAEQQGKPQPNDPKPSVLTAARAVIRNAPDVLKIKDSGGETIAKVANRHKDTKVWFDALVAAG